MANVTYLLGAGASYDAIPTVKELADQISIMIGVMKIIENGQSTRSSEVDYGIFRINNDPTYKNMCTNAISDLQMLRQGCIEHLSIDTYLKMLFLTRNVHYEKMKATMVLFFCLHQCLHKYIKSYSKANAKKDLVDKRYDAFIASILQNTYDNFPKNIKIISWNYDNQFEKAYQKYLEHASSESTADEALNMYHKNEQNNAKSLDFAIYKINGTASYFNRTLSKLLPRIDTNIGDTNGQLKKLLTEYHECINNNTLTPAISFSWDNPKETNKMINDISFSVLNTEILVLIGYSMPFFNRNIDTQILNKRTMPSLKKVYIQDIHPEGIVERVHAIRPDLKARPYIRNNTELPAQILAINDITQFYLPNEL